MDATKPHWSQVIARRLYPYVTILLKCHVDAQDRRRVDHIGSGTYVKVAGKYGILTASHSAALLTNEFLLGVSAAREGVEHNFFLQARQVDVSHLATRESDEFGPDLAFITIKDSEKIAQIAAAKSFHDLARDSERMLHEPPPPSRSIWYVSGVPNRTITTLLPGEAFEATFQYQEYCGAGGADRMYERGGYDYIEMDITQPSDDTLPPVLDGMSGGGLWQVPITPGEDGKPAAVDHFLAGVIFFENRATPPGRFLRCHGIRTLYTTVLGALR